MKIRTILIASVGGKLSNLTCDALELSNLGGRLYISNLGHGEDDMVECKATNMKEKQHLQRLRLCWDKKWDDGESECYDEMSLEGLQPHPNLKMLELSYYMGVRIPSWVSSLSNLVNGRMSQPYFHAPDSRSHSCIMFVIVPSYGKEAKSENWPIIVHVPNNPARKNNLFRRLQHLPPLNQLPFLKFVQLSGMEAIEYILDKVNVSNVLGGSSSSSSKTPFFPSLSSLVIIQFPKLKGWWRNSYDDDNEPHHLLLPSFPPCLSQLRIFDCPNLTSMPLIPNLTNSYICDCPFLRQRGKQARVG
ncbi:putative disease resistance protein rga1 [Quercus suber]|uniref:Disease resistance protein rga1 n=1 Tax=Quercus suber TaxID=58331 RepID=A0AAW0IY33_QUESU